LPCAALGRDHLDVVNLRRMRPDSSPSASARSPGLIRHLGLSDVTTAHLAEALAITPTEVVPHVDLTVSAVKSMSVLRTSYRVAAMQA
jgi:aryl-alcohol dehydrogenase-like predicted oxidoreductase